MAFCIVRTKKLKSLAAVAGSAIHTFRESATPNADPTRTPKNRITGARSCAGVLAALRDRLPERRRRDAVVAVEYLITASPEYFLDPQTGNVQTRSSYFNAALTFLKAKHGSANVLSAALHLDETSPHMVVYVIPLTSDGRLSAKDFLGGKEKMKQLQTDFHVHVGARFGLERGIKGARANHVTIQKFYANLEKPSPLKRLSRLDQFAAAVGIQTRAMTDRKRQEESIVGMLAVGSPTALVRAKRDIQTAARERIAARQAEAALKHRLEAAEKINSELSKKLAMARHTTEETQALASNLYQQNQQLRIAERQFSTTTPNQKDMNNAAQNRKPRLAP